LATKQWDRRPRRSEAPQQVIAIRANSLS